MNRKITHYLCLILLGFISEKAYAQNYTQRKEFRLANSHWFTVGENNSIGNLRIFDLRNKPATVYKIEQIRNGESGSGISDTSSGELLFYSDGIRVRDRNHEIMSNGRGLYDTIITNETRYNSFLNRLTSSFQQICIVPFIENSEKYHLFSVLPVAEKLKGLIYAEVDMSLNKGMGDVKFHKQVVKNPLVESIVAVPGNNCDAWILAISSENYDILAFHITKDGIDSVPVVSNTGVSISSSLNDRMGGVAISPDRSKLAFTIKDMGYYANGNQPKFPDTTALGIVLAEFDPETGKVSNGLKVDHYKFGSGIIFSPDGTKLYATGMDIDSSLFVRLDQSGLINESGSITQYDLSEYSQEKIMASKYYVVKDHPMLFFWNTALGFRSWGDTIVVSDFTYISNPNEAGVQCGYVDTTSFFDQETGSWICLGNNAVYPLPTNKENNVHSLYICSKEGSTILRAPYSSTEYNYTWNTGSNDSIITITEDGKYWVTYEKYCHTGTDTFKVQLIHILEPTISVNEKVLTTTEEYENYQWLINGAAIPDGITRDYIPKVNGNYQIAVRSGECKDTSAVYIVNNVTNVQDLPNFNQITIYPNPATDAVYINFPEKVDVIVIGVDGKIYKRLSQCNKISIGELADGVYTLRIKNTNGELLNTEKLIKASSSK